MYYEFYLDVYFLENLIVNCLVLRLAGRIQNERLSCVRAAAAAVLGAAASCAAAVMPVHKNTALALLLSLLLLWLMALAAAGDARRGTRFSLTVLGTALLLAAIWQILMGSLKIPFYLAVPAGYAGAACAWKCARRLLGRAQYLYDVTLRRGVRQTRLRGLLDSGNCLVQPGTARPVHIADYDQIKELLDEGERQELLCMLELKTEGAHSGKFAYIPYHSVGDSGGVLPAILLDEICVRHGERTWSAREALTAVSGQPVSGRGEYQIILHPRILE